MESATRHKHVELHNNIGYHNPIIDEHMQSVSVITNAEDLETRKQEFDRIMNEKTIRNDYDMSIVLNILKKMRKGSLPKYEEEQERQLNSMIIEYYRQADDKNIRVLSLDGGG